MQSSLAFAASRVRSRLQSSARKTVRHGNYVDRKAHVDPGFVIPPAGHQKSYRRRRVLLLRIVSGDPFLRARTDAAADKRTRTLGAAVRRQHLYARIAGQFTAVSGPSKVYEQVG